MARRQRHHFVGMLDALAERSGLRRVSPELKTAFSVLVLLLCVAAADAVVSYTAAEALRPGEENYPMTMEQFERWQKTII